MTDKTAQQRLEAIYLEVGLLAERSADAEALNTIKEELAQVIKQLPQEEVELSFSDQLRQGISRFEAEHPTLAKAAEEIVDNLARLGI